MTTLETISEKIELYADTRKAQYAMMDANDALTNLGLDPEEFIYGKAQVLMTMADQELRDFVSTLAECRVNPDQFEEGVDHRVEGFLNYHGYEGWRQDLEAIIKNEY